MLENLLSCRPASYQEFADGAYAHLASIGVKYVEIPVPSDIDVELAKLTKHGLKALSVQAACELETEDGVERFGSQIDVAVNLGVKFMFVSANTRGKDKSVCYERLRRMGEAAAAQGVTIVLETHPDLVTNGEVGRQTMAGVNHPNVRINWDTANVYHYNEGIDGIAELQKVIEFIGAVHLKDTSGKFKAWNFPAFGEGVVDFKEVFRLMNARGFYGPFTMEIEGVEGESLDRAATEARVAKSVAHLRSLGCVA